MDEEVSLEDKLATEFVDEHETISRKSEISKRKSLGAYYTPPELAELVISHAVSMMPRDLADKDKIKLIDPAVGEGVFAESIISHKNHKELSNLDIEFTGIDIEERALTKTRENIEQYELNGSEVDLELVNQDFFSWKWEGYQSSYDLIVGNPPWGVPSSDSSYDLRYKDISLDFVYQASQIFSSKTVLSFLLPGTWLFSRSYTGFRKFLLGLDRDIKVVQVSEDWFDGTYTVDPIALFIGPKKDGENFFEFLDYTEFPQTTEKLYEVSQKELSNYLGKRFPAVRETYHRFVGGSSLEGLERTTDLGLKAYGGLKTYNNPKYIFGRDEAKKLDSEGEAEIRDELSESEKKNGVESDSIILIPYDKGGKTRNKEEWTAFWTPAMHYVRWDQEAVDYYETKNSKRNEDKYFSSGINFSSSGRNCPVFRLSNGLVFDADYPFVPIEDEENLMTVLSILNSPCCMYLIKHAINPTAHFKNQDFRDVFLPNYKELDTSKVKAIGEEILENRKSNSGTPESLYRNLSKEVAKLYKFDEEEEERAWKWFKQNRLK